MKRQLILGTLILGMVTNICSCGPSAAEKERLEKERQDSINMALRNAEIADSLRADSIIKAKKAARQKDLMRDSTEIANLLPQFDVIKDPAFENKYQYVYKGTSTAHFINNFYLSFTTMTNSVDELLLNIDVEGDLFKSDAIMIDYAQIIIGDDSYDIPPIGETKLKFNEQDNYKRGEWMSGEVSSSLMDKILDANSIKIKIKGSNDKLISVTSAELKKMKVTIELYQFMKEYGPNRVRTGLKL